MTHDDVMFDNNVPSPPQCGLYIDDFETYLDKIDGDSPCLFNMVVDNLLNADDVFLLSRSCVGLERLLNKPNEFCTSSIQVNLAKTKIMVFGRNKRKLNQVALYLDKDQIKITHEYKSWGETTRTLVPWRQGFRHPTRNECMGYFAQI